MSQCTVTGANGFVGQNVVRALLARGYDVTALVGDDRGSECLDGLPVKIRELDLLDPTSIRKALDGGTNLIHTAANYSFWLPDAKRGYRVNVEGTQNVLTTARHLGYERVVHTSSTATLSPGFGRAEGDENSVIDLHRFAGHYKTSKVMAELVATRLAAEGFPLVIVYPTIVLGPGDSRPTPTGSMVVHFINGRMKAFVDMPQNLVDVEDVAEGHVLALERGARGGRYVLGGDNLSMREVVDILGELTGIPAPRVALPLQLLRSLAICNEFVSDRLTRREPLFPLEASLHARDSQPFSSERARSELGFSARPAREVLARALAWFLREGFAGQKTVRRIEQRGELARLLGDGPAA